MMRRPRILVLVLVVGAVAATGCYSLAPDGDRFVGQPFNTSVRDRTAVVVEEVVFPALDPKLARRQPFPLNVAVMVHDPSELLVQEPVGLAYVPLWPTSAKEGKAFWSRDLVAHVVTAALHRQNLFDQVAVPDPGFRTWLYDPIALAGGVSRPCAPDAVLVVELRKNRGRVRHITYCLSILGPLFFGLLAAPTEVLTVELEVRFALYLRMSDRTQHCIFVHDTQAAAPGRVHSMWYGWGIYDRKWKLIAGMLNDFHKALEAALPSPRDPLFVRLERPERLWHPLWLTKGPPGQPTSAVPGIAMPPLGVGPDEAALRGVPPRPPDLEAALSGLGLGGRPTVAEARREPAPHPAPRRPAEPVPPPAPPRPPVEPISLAPAPAPAPNPTPPPPIPPTPAPTPAPAPAPPPPPPPSPPPPPPPPPPEPVLTLDSTTDETFEAKLLVSGTFADAQGVLEVEILVNGGVARKVSYGGEASVRFSEEVDVAVGRNQIQVRGIGKGGKKSTTFLVVRYPG